MLALLWNNCRVFLSSHYKEVTLENCIWKNKFIWGTTSDLIDRLFYLATEKYVVLIILDCEKEACFKANPYDLIDSK